MRTPTLVLFILVTVSQAALAQHEGHAQHSSPYAGQEASGIAALSVEQVQQLRDGAGMGMARAAELNRYPGPKHVLEMAAELDLSAVQESALSAVHDEMLAEAMRLGAAVLAEEETLQRRFAHRHIDETALRSSVTEVARLRGELRFTHLSAHLKTAQLLSATQMESYDRLRGYL